jgi:hypothetical protein
MSGTGQERSIADTQAVKGGQERSGADSVRACPDIEGWSISLPASRIRRVSVGWELPPAPMKLSPDCDRFGLRVRVAVLVGAMAGLASSGVAQGLTWVTQFGSDTEDFELLAFTHAGAVAADPSGVFVVGSSYGSLGGPSAGNMDAWIARLDAASSTRWKLQLGTNKYDSCRAVASDGLGGAFVSGWTLGSLMGPYSGDGDCWIAHLDRSGALLWTRQFGPGAAAMPYAAAPDGSGGFYLGGFTSGTVAAPPAGGFDAWFARFDGDGNRLWMRQVGTAGYDWVWDLASDGAGGVVLAGVTEGALFGASKGDRDAWLARFDAAGYPIWTSQLGSSEFDQAMAITATPSGSIYVGGNTLGTLDGQAALGKADVWVARFDSNGSQDWLVQLGSEHQDILHDLLPAPDDGAYLFGDSGRIPPAATALNADAWVTRLSASGLSTLEHRMNIGPFGQTGRACAAPDGGLYFVGQTYRDVGGPNAGSSDPWVARFDF